MYRNHSTEEVLNVTLDQLNNEQARIYYGAVALLAVLIIPGIVGNLHVLHIYIFKKPNNNTRVYVCFIGVMDLVSCAISFPSIIVNNLLPLTYYNDIACKLLTWLNSYFTTCAAFALLATAIERYRKICTPFKSQITLRQAKLSCALVLILTALLSFPVLILYGSTEIPTRHPNITGFECHIYVEFRGTFFEVAYNAMILCIAASLCLSFSVMYTLIGIRIRHQHSKMNLSKTIRDSALAHSRVCNRENDMNSSKIRENEINRNESNRNDSESLSDNSQTKENQNTSNETNSKGNDKTISRKFRTIMERIVSRHVKKEESSMNSSQDSLNKDSIISISTINTKQLVLRRRKPERIKQMNMFFLITLFYLLSYIPYPVLRLYRTFNMDWYNGLSHPGLVTFHLAMSSLFLNNVANSFIYMVCDSSYRKELGRFYGKLFCRQ